MFFVLFCFISLKCAIRPERAGGGFERSRGFNKTLLQSHTIDHEEEEDEEGKEEVEKEEEEEPEVE